MRAVVQRVTEARVCVASQEVGAIGRGVLVLLCAMAGDTPRDEAWMLDKILALRVFPDDSGKMNLALGDLPRPVAGAAVPSAGPTALRTSPGVLVVSQFTLAADLAPGRSKGNRPAFTAAMAPAAAAAAVDRFIAGCRTAAPWLSVAQGVFGADMQVSLTNDGPVTLHLDSASTSLTSLGRVDLDLPSQS